MKTKATKLLDILVSGGSVRHPILGELSIIKNEICSKGSWGFAGEEVHNVIEMKLSTFLKWADSTKG